MNVIYMLHTNLYIDDERIVNVCIFPGRGCRGRDCMVVGFITACAIGAYHH